jgi:transmembrane sensor
MPGYNGNNRVRLVSQEAAYWYFLCVDDPTMLRSDRREFLSWMRRSPENIAELFKIAQLDGKLRKLKLTMRSLGLKNSNVVEFTTSGSPYNLHRELVDRHVAEKKSTKRQPLTLKLAAFAASVLVGAGLAFLVNQDSEEVVRTGASQWHQMALPDATAVSVDARSEVEVAYTEKARIVHLKEGNAVFTVTKDPKRPFIVRTDLVDVMAVGTRFGVSIDGDHGVTTTVSEGIVKVTGRKSDGRSVMVEAGQELFVADPRLTSPFLAQVDAVRNLEWAATGMLVLDGMTVAQGVKEFNRRNRVQIHVDPSLAGQTVEVAAVKVDSPLTYAKSVASNPGITMVLERGGEVIRLTKSE